MDTPFQTLLVNGETMCYFAQHPNPSDRFLIDEVTEWTSGSPANITTTSIQDSNQFVQSDPTYWVDSWVGRWVTGNAANWKKITGYDPANYTISYATGGNGPYTDRDGWYTIVGHPLHVDTPGEYAYSPSENRLYFWPHDSQNPSG